MKESSAFICPPAGLVVGASLGLWFCVHEVLPCSLIENTSPGRHRILGVEREPSTESMLS